MSQTQLGLAGLVAKCPDNSVLKLELTARLMDNGDETDAAGPGLQGRKAGHLLVFAVLAGVTNRFGNLCKSPVAALCERRWPAKPLQNHGGHRPPLQPRMTLAEVWFGVETRLWHRSC
jgi:hypothetical protein